LLMLFTEDSITTLNNKLTYLLNWLCKIALLI
jgi:hypothetical protein